MKRFFLWIACTLFTVPALAQSTTTNLGVTKPQTGQNQPQVTIATGFDSFDAAIAGRLSKSVAGSSDVTLTAAEARNAIHEYAGTLTGNINVIVPAKNKVYLVYNNTSGAFTLTVKTASGTGVAVTQGQRVWLYCDATNVVALSSSVSSASAVTVTVANEGSTGTLTNGLAKLTGAPSTATRTATSDTGGAVGIVTSGAGTSGSATIQVAGLCSCVFSGATTAGNYVVISDATAGNCKDGGSSFPTSSQAIGRVLSTNGSGGTYQLLLFGPEERGGSGSGSTLVDFKDSVRVATTTAGTLSTSFENGDTVDGVTLATGDRILIKDQSSGAENGIYVVAASGAPTRATDADASAEVTAGLLVAVAEGTANADKLFLLTTNDAITLGSTSLTFTAYTGGGGSGLSDPGSNGMLARTSSGTTTARTITGTTNQVTVTNGDGVGGNPTLALPQSIHTGATPQWTRLGLGTAASALHAIDIALGTQTLDAHIINGAITWNNASTDFTADFINVTNTASGSLSKLIDRQVGGSSKFYVDKSGNAVLAGNLKVATSGSANQLAVTDGSGNISFANCCSGMWAATSGTGSQTIDWTTVGTTSVRQFTVTSNTSVTFSFTAPRQGTICTLIFIRDATGTAAVNWPSSVKWPGGSSFPPTTGANVKDVFTFIYDGTNYLYQISSSDVK